MNLYSNKSSDPRINAQQNLEGRTHYVDPDTLRWHKSRVLSAHVVDGGLLFAIVESCAIDPDNRRRGFRGVVFDIFGHVVSRPDLDGCEATRHAAAKRMWAAINSMDAVALTGEAIAREERHHAMEMERLRQILVQRLAA